MCNCNTILNPIALPFAWVLMLFYRLFQGAPDNESKFAYALSLILIAIFVRLLMLPFQMKSKKGMLKQTRLQPKLAELQKRHGANKQKLNEETAKLYREEGVNPASGCLWSFIQMPIMFALFYAIRQPITLMMGLSHDLMKKGGAIYEQLISLFNKGALNPAGGFSTELTRFLENPENSIDSLENLEQLGFYHELYASHEISEHWEMFRNLGIEGLSRISFYLGNINLAETPNWQFFWSSNTNWSGGQWVPGLFLFLLPILSGATQFVSAHINRKISPQPATPDGKTPGGAMMKFMPLMSVWFGFILPGALSLYWTIGTCLQIGQDIWLTKKYTKILDAEDIVREADRSKREAEIEAKRLETERLKAEGLIAENPNTSKRKKQKAEKQSQKERAAQWEKNNSPLKGKKDKEDEEPSRVGNRRYARGRAYDPGRYAKDAAAAALSSATGTDSDNTDGEDTDKLNKDNPAQTGGINDDAYSPDGENCDDDSEDGFDDEEN